MTVTPFSASEPDLERFPHPVYAKTVLAPLFRTTLAHHAADMDTINQAHLVMLVETGILGPDDAAAIAAALRSIASETDRDALTYTGEHEDWFFYVESELRARLGDLGGALHTGRSRNDMDHTLFRMRLRRLGDDMQTQLIALATALADKAEAEAETIVVAYTHGQPAQPTTFGHYLAAVLDVLARDIERFDAALAGLERCPMGAAAITTTGFAIDRARVADLLGFDGPTTNSYASIAAVDYVTGYYSALKLPFVHLGRVAQDMAFWSAHEVGQLHVPGSFVQISSIMPQKRNPVPIEHMRHLASVTVGRCDVLVDVMRNTPFTDMNDVETEVQAAGTAAHESGGRMLDLLTAFVPACGIDAGKVRRNLDASCATITELADTLVRESGLTFRTAHEIAASAARDVIARCAALSDGFEAHAAAHEAVTGRPSPLDADAFAEAVAPETFVARRDRFGGPAPAALAEALAGYRETIDRLDAARATRTKRRDRADTARRDAFDALGRTTKAGAA